MTHPPISPRSSGPLRFAKWLVFAAFVLSALVQLNDPDPIAWIAIYGAAATACLLDLLGRGSWTFAAAVGTVALVWGLLLAPGVLGRVPFLSMFEAWEMRNVGIERSREMYGLFGIAAWMGWLALRGRGTAAGRDRRGDDDSG